MTKDYRETTEEQFGTIGERFIGQFICRARKRQAETAKNK
jgi:hypothetical protein